LVSINNVFIDARFKYETQSVRGLYVNVDWFRHIIITWPVLAEYSCDATDSAWRFLRSVERVCRV